MKKRLDPDTVKTQDKFIRAILKQLNNNVKVDMSLADELDSLMIVSKDNKGVAVRIPYGKNGPEDLVKVGTLMSKTQSYKDRVREINLSFMSVMRQLLSLRGKCDNYLKRQYGKELFAMKPAEVRNSFINSVLEDIDNKIDEVTSIQERSEVVLQNLTDTYWTLKEISAIAQRFFPEMGALTQSGPRKV